MMHALQLVPLTRWTGPQMLLIRPRIGHIGWLSFSHTEALIAEGYRAGRKRWKGWRSTSAARTGVFPRRRVRIDVNRQRMYRLWPLCRARARDNGARQLLSRLRAPGPIPVVTGGRRLHPTVSGGCAVRALRQCRSDVGGPPARPVATWGRRISRPRLHAADELAEDVRRGRFAPEK